MSGFVSETFRQMDVFNESVKWKIQYNLLVSMNEWIFCSELIQNMRATGMNENTRH